MKQNIILLVLDSVRKDFFDEYAVRIKARSDYSFKECRAASSWSAPSHASMFTGLLPHEHGVSTYNRKMGSLTDYETICDLLQGYHTVGYSANMYASPAYGFDSEFDSFIEVPRYQRYPEALNAVSYFHKSDKEGLDLYMDYLQESISNEYPIKSLINGSLAQLKQLAMEQPIPDPVDDGAKLMIREIRETLRTATEPTFVFANFMESHEPFGHIWGLDKSIHGVPSSWTSASADRWDLIYDQDLYDDHVSRLKGLYAANIDYLDRLIASLIDSLSNMERETTIIVTADHGENLGNYTDDELFGHTSSLSDGLLHVPLEVINLDRSATISEYISHLQLPKFIENISNGEDDIPTSECIFSEVLGMAPGPQPPEDQTYWKRGIRCAYSDERKYEWDSLGNKREFTVPKGTPNHQKQIDELETIPEWARDGFKNTISKAVSEAEKEETTTEVDAATEARLNDLGYM
ncbi:sulfatase [halophilic archaeon]|nr:sulfatase [halophilic archaeon]